MSPLLRIVRKTNDSLPSGIDHLNGYDKNIGMFGL